MSPSQSRPRYRGDHIGLLIAFLLGALLIVFIRPIRDFVDAIVPDIISPSAASGDDDVAPNPAPDPAPHYPGDGLNQVVQDGRFEFTVTEFSCGLRRVGAESAGKNARGKYCIAAITVKNSSGEPLEFFSGYQYVYDSTRTRYYADTEAGIYVGAIFLTEIAPGGLASGGIAFDVPLNVSIEHLELHESLTSRGITLSITDANRGGAN